MHFRMIPINPGSLYNKKIQSLTKSLIIVNNEQVFKLIVKTLVC